MNVIAPMVIIIDIALAGYEHNVLVTSVQAALTALQKSEMCLGILLTLPCSPWGVQRFRRPGPPVLFTLDAVDGIESDIPDVKSSITAALAMCQFGINMAEIAIERKQAWMWESSVGHGKGSIWPMAGKDLHSIMWHTTLLTKFMVRHELSLIYADRCMTGCQQRKTAGVLASHAVAPLARLTIGMLKCTHKSHSAPPEGQHGTGIYRSEAMGRLEPGLYDCACRACE